ncbi:hypothetical protein ACIHEI_06410 [Kitasatospora sp. NPDC051984]|uniref:hypothetical protein n=1 Tax=Kitasatospora sp. NPDC051984 TaxID=3364059 RepID=UPI0037C541C8
MPASGPAAEADRGRNGCAVVSKTLRHATLATTINLYGNPFKDSADQAVKALSTALDHADSRRSSRPSAAVGDLQRAA